MEEQDLIDMGIRKKPHRKKILKEIAKLTQPSQHSQHSEPVPSQVNSISAYLERINNNECNYDTHTSNIGFVLDQLKKDCRTIRVSHEDQEYEHKIYENPKDWDKEIYSILCESIAQKFSISTKFVLYQQNNGDDNILFDIEDVSNAFEAASKKILQAFVKVKIIFSSYSLNRFIHILCNIFVQVYSEQQSRAIQEYQVWFKQELGLPQYYKNFLKQGYEDLSFLDADIDENELMNDLKISKKPHRKKILNEIEKLVEKRKRVTREYQTEGVSTATPGATLEEKDSEEV